MTQPLKFEEAFDFYRANNVLLNLCEDVARNGSVTLANYRTRLAMHTLPGFELDREGANPVLVTLCNDIADHGSVDLPHYRALLMEHVMVVEQATTDDTVSAQQRLKAIREYLSTESAASPFARTAEFNAGFDIARAELAQAITRLLDGNAATLEKITGTPR